MSSKIYFNTRRFSPSKWLLGLGTRLHHTLAPAHAKRTASSCCSPPSATSGMTRRRPDWSNRPCTPAKVP